MKASSNRFVDLRLTHSYFQPVNTLTAALSSAQYCAGSTQKQLFDSMVFSMVL
jgi:hypothetical protein